MELKRTIAKNTLAIIAGKITQLLVGLIVIHYLAGYLGVEKYGIYTFVYAFVGSFMILTDVGINTILVRKISRDRDKSNILAGNALILKLFLSILTILVAYFLIYLLGYSYDTRLLVYIAGLNLLFSFRTAYTVIFQVDLKNEFIVAFDILNTTLSAILTLAVIFLKGSLAQIFTVQLLSYLPGYMLSIYFANKRIKPELKIDLRLWKELVYESLPLGLAFVFSTIYTRIDIIMLSLMKGEVAVGIYGAGVALYNIIIIIPTAMAVTVFPLMSKFYKKDNQTMGIVYSKTFEYLMMVGLPLSIGTILIASRVIKLIFGTDFALSVLPLQILAVAGIIVFAENSMSPMLISIKRQKIWLMITFFGSAINVGLNLLIIPILSYVGTAITTIVTHLFIAFASFYFVKKHTELGFKFRKPIVYLFCSIVMGGVVYSILNQNLIIIVLVAFIVYFGLIFILDRENTEDIVRLSGLKR